MSKNHNVSDYPAGATPLVASSGAVGAAIAAATLTPDADKQAFLSGFEVTGAGATTALPVSVTVTGIAGGTLTYSYTAIAGVLLANQPLVVQFSPPIPASAINTAIVVSCPTLGSGNTKNTTNAHGYQLKPNF